MGREGSTNALRISWIPVNGHYGEATALNSGTWVAPLSSFLQQQTTTSISYVNIIIIINTALKLLLTPFWLLFS
jgi:hypothetical protein